MMTLMGEIVRYRPCCVTESDTIFGQGTMPEPATSYIGQEVALDAQAAVLVYIEARISQIAETHSSFPSHVVTCLDPSIPANEQGSFGPLLQRIDRAWKSAGLDD